MPIIKMDLPEGWQLLESWPDTKGNHVYRLMDNRTGKPIALCEYQEMPKEEMVRRAIAFYIKRSGG